MDQARQLLSVLFVLGLLLAALWALRRKGLTRFTPGAGRGKSRRNAVLIERLPLTAQHALHLVRVADRALLIGTGPSGCSLVEGFAWKDVQADSGGTN